jgi:cytochrome b pre-mRNA-processing protein 6
MEEGVCALQQLTALPSQTAYKHYLRALRRWPIDILRPEHSFQATIRRRVDARLLRPQSPSTSQPIDETTELAQVNALYSLLENRYNKKYPISDSFLKPASNPTYYADLLAEIKEAPNRSWMGRMMNRWKGFLRFS